MLITMCLNIVQLWANWNRTFFLASVVQESIRLSTDKAVFTLKRVNEPQYNGPRSSANHNNFSDRIGKLSFRWTVKHKGKKTNKKRKRDWHNTDIRFGRDYQSKLV